MSIKYRDTEGLLFHIENDTLEMNIIVVNRSNIIMDFVKCYQCSVKTLSLVTLLQTI